MSLQRKRKLRCEWTLSSNQSQNLLRKGYNNAARKGEEAVGPLGRVVALEGEAHLNDAPAQRSNGFLTLAGGIVITFSKEILTLITG